MSLPSVNDAHVDQLLTNLLVGYKNKNYIYDQIFPIIKTGGVESGRYGIFTQADQFRNEAETIAAGGPYPVGGFRVSTTTYSTEEIGQATDLPDRTLANASGAFKKSLRMAKARWCADKVELRREIDTATLAFASSWGTNDTTATDWDDYSNSDPLLDINTAMYTVLAATGEEPNVGVLGSEVWKDLKINPSVLDLLGANERGKITLDLLASHLEIDKLLVGKAIYNSAVEGQSGVYANCWGQNALFIHVNPATPDPYTASAGYTFESAPMMIKTWREGGRDTEFFRARIIQDQKIVGSNLGYYFSGIVS